MSTDSGIEKLGNTAEQPAENSARAHATKVPSSTVPSSTAAGSNFQMQNPDVLVAAHQGLVISVANSIYRRVPRHIPKEDLISYGQVGLVQAARTYRPQPDTEFGTFAYYRISGAIYEGLTRMNWTSRAEYRRRKAEAAANEVLLQDAESKSRTGSAAEQAAWLDGSVKQLSAVFLLSQMPDGEGGKDDPADPGQTPFQEAAGGEMQQLIHQAVAGLPEEAQQLIQLVYFEDHSLAQAAQVMGKSRSWASRYHGAVLEKLATRLSGVEE